MNGHCEALPATEYCVLLFDGGERDSSGCDFRQDNDRHADGCAIQSQRLTTR